jgi:hypothetical protein
VEASHFEESEFFSAIAASGARALPIGRRALIALGMPLLTRDYDSWIHGDDVASFNSAVSAFDLFPSHSPEEARAKGANVNWEGCCLSFRSLSILQARACGASVNVEPSRRGNESDCIELPFRDTIAPL